MQHPIRTSRMEAKMAGTSRAEFKETFHEFYRTNYDYHNAKEQQIWLVLSAYMTFAAAVVAWCLSGSMTNVLIQWAARCLSVAVCAFAFTYVAIQNWYKAKSVFIECELMRQLKKLDSTSVPTYADLIVASHPKAENYNGDTPWKVFSTNGKAGIVALGLMIFLLMVQIGASFIN
jgi:hypothetical protein